MNVDKIMAYENGELSPMGILEMFAEGIRTGIVWSFQGHYGRTANQLVSEGWISPAGEITPEALARFEQTEGNE